MTLDEMHAAARAAVRESSRWVYRRTYVGGLNTIACREPRPGHEPALMSVRSSSYAKHAGVSVSAARDHLRALAAAGRLTARPRRRPGAILAFALPEAESIEIGRELIAELVAEGLIFDDERMAVRR